jgi:hypothetical protein
MGQKVHPRARRHGVALRPSQSLLFRAAKAGKGRGEGRGEGQLVWSEFSLRPNPSGSADRVGWESTLVSDRRSERAPARQYGASLSKRVRIRQLVEETLSAIGLMANRIFVRQEPQSTSLRIEVIHPMSGTILTEQRDRRHHELRVVGRVYTAQHGGTPLQWEVVPLLNQVSRSPQFKEAWDGLNDKRGKGSGRVVQGTSVQRVGEVALNGVALLAGMTPVASSMAQRVSWCLEEAESQQQVIRQLSRVLKEASSNPIFGLLQFKDKEGQAKGRGVDDQQRESHSQENLYDTNPEVSGGYRGYRLYIKGPIDGARRTRHESHQGGALPLSTITQPMAYHHTVALTKYGTVGVAMTYAY